MTRSVRALIKALLKVSKYSIITTATTVVAILVIVLLLQSPRHRWLAKTEIVVYKNTYDSLVAIANRPPIVTVDTIRDTIPGKTIYKDKLVPVYLDSLITVYSDTLPTKYFTVTLLDSLRYNRIFYRAWDFESYPEIITEYVEKEKPVFYYVDHYITTSPMGLYGGGSVGIYSKGFKISGDLTFLAKNSMYYGGSLGVVSSFETNFKNYPLVEFRLGKKF